MEILLNLNELVLDISSAMATWDAAAVKIASEFFNEKRCGHAAGASVIEVICSMTAGRIFDICLQVHVFSQRCV